MANNKLELVVEVDVGKANASIKSINAGLSSIEQAAVKGARGAAAGIDGLTVSMVKGATAGNLLADAIKSALSWAKQWTLGAVQAAAHEAKLEASMLALAKAHGISAGAAAAAAKAVRDIGFYGEEATHTISRMIIADMDLSKATGLAKIAKDAAAIENISAGEAMEKLMLALEGGVSRGLRSMGIFVDFNKEVERQQLRLGRTLSDAEVQQVRYNAVMREGAKIQGAHAAAAEEAEGQTAKLRRAMAELREAVGERFQEQYRMLLGNLNDGAKWLRENVDLLTKFGQVALWVSGVLATYALAKKIMDLAKAVAALRLASMNPYALLATGVVAAGAIVYSEFKDMGARRERDFADKKQQQIRRMVASGKSLAELRAMGLSGDEIRAAVGGKAAGEFSTGVTVKTGNAGPDADALKLAAEIRKKQAEAERESRREAIQAGAKSALGFGKDIAEVNAQIDKWTSFVDEKGVEHRFALTAQAWKNVIDQVQGRWATFRQAMLKDNREHLAEQMKQWDEFYQKRLDREWDLLRQRNQFDEEFTAQAMENAKQVYAFEEQRAGYRREAALRGVEGMDAQTLPQKVAVEQRKMEIEVEYLEKTHEIKLRLFDAETSMQAMAYELEMKRLGFMADEVARRIGQFTEQREAIRQQVQEANDEAVTAAQENGAIRQAQLIRDHSQQIFQSLKEQAGGVFDALLQKSQSVWSAIGNSLKTAVLTAIKDVVTSRVAAMLMQLLTGTRVSLAGGGAGGGGLLASLGGMAGFGAVPVFGVGPVPGAMGGSWGTPPFLPGGSGGAGGATGGAGGAGNLFSGAGLAGSLAGLKSFLGIGGSIQTGAGMATTWGAATMGQKLSAIGKSNAALMGGALLAMDGLRRGGKLGLAETTAGGALIGFKYGGPLGAVIGGIAGAVAGTIRLFVKGAQEKAREKIKATYGVDIPDKGLLKQIVDTAKQAYGGNLDMAIRSQEIRDLIELYALSTGQKPTGMPGTPRPTTLAQMGGSLYQQSGYSNGSPLPSSGGLPTGDSIGAGTASHAGATVIQLDGPATTALLRGEAVETIAANPRVVQRAAMAATRANAGRRQMATLQLSPGLLTA